MAIIEIGSSSSYCSSCRRPASLQENGHYTLLGYGEDNGQPGCQEPWTGAILTTYTGSPIHEQIEESWWLPVHIKRLLRVRYWDDYPDEFKRVKEIEDRTARWRNND